MDLTELEKLEEDDEDYQDESDDQQAEDTQSVVNDLKNEDRQYANEHPIKINIGYENKGEMKWYPTTVYSYTTA